MSTGDQHTVAFEKNIANPIFNGKIRGTDCQGSGAYGASRGNRTHEGIDIVAKVGAQVCSPIDGTLTRKAYPYAKDLKYTGVLLTGTGKHKGYTIKIFYMNVWNEVIGQEVTMGETILGTVQDIAAKYPCQKGKMTNHIHVEVRKNGGLIDPTHIITWQSPTPSAWEKVFQSVVLPPYRF
ncbi:MAG: M23 family metallopeptidase [Pseudomonadota bacterium]|nr:M23 family metallopeptidase [Pseudomonadota bacterium]